MQQVFATGQPLTGALVELERMSLTVSIVPITMDDGVVGAVCTLQKQNEIKNIE
ncbi:MAG: hypothetical protein QRY16_17770 [Enterobacterales bacterium endosymbiont of Blomia tropicalis]|uniref:hypothetical protein n=1 Tax=Mixta mediterraneensis TaxID=2758443 RepID=UPI0025A75A08|nr:hypothetical protein [Mixta mediterraneensis]MDL4915548.1 hypothetical protein [Mixta mediterraneensis]